MSKFKVCPHCGAHLDPGEVCDCLTHQVCTEARETFPEYFTGKTDREIVHEITEVLQRAERAAPSAANTEDGKAEHVDHVASSSNDT